MIYCNQTSLDELVGYLVAICAARLNRTAAGPVALEEVARKAGIVVHGEVFVPFEMAVACATGYFYPMDVLSNMVVVGEFDAGIVDFR